MDRIQRKCRLKFAAAIAILVFFLLSAVSIVQADVMLFTDQSEWEDILSEMEVFTTISANIALADEVPSQPGLNEYLGPILTFQAINTGLSRGFLVETLQPGAQFTFNDTEGGVPLVSFENALSVGDNDDYEDDDWQLSLLDGTAMTAFGVEIRHSRFAPGESITLYSGAVLVGTIDLSSLPGVGNENYFFGIVSDVSFDRIGFNEDPDGDDIAIADFRFAEIGYKCAIEPKEGRVIVELGPPSLCSPTEVNPDCLGQSGPFVLDPNIPAGTYAVTLQSYDNHTRKPQQQQSEERYFLRLNLADGNIVDTGAIGDLPDGSGNDNLIQLVNTNLGVNAHIASILAIHYCDESTGNLCDDSGPNSIVPVCVAFDLLKERTCKDGHHKYGHHKYGHHKDGHYDGDGCDKDGRDRYKHFKYGHRDGDRCDKEGNHRDGHHRDGHHKDGHYDGDGCDKDGRDRYKHNKDGHHDGDRCDKNGSSRGDGHKDGYSSYGKR